MLTDSILRLKVAFANIPWKGLFFWEGLLFLNDEEYKKIVEENFINIMNSFPAEEKETATYYKEILADLQEVRKEIADNSKIKNEVEKIRDALMAETAHETLIEAMKDSLSKKGSEDQR